MKIAIIGNMNNLAANLVRYLGDAGLDVTVLFFDNEASHFMPDSDSFFDVEYKTERLAWGSYFSYFMTSQEKICSDLSGFDFLIGTRLAPAFCRKAGRHLDVFMPTGGELHSLPVWNGFKPSDLIKYIVFSRIQRDAIMQVGALYWDSSNPEVESTIAPYTSHLLRIKRAIPLIYYPDFQGFKLEQAKSLSTYYEQFKEIRKSSIILLVSHVKHVWRKETISKYGKFHAKGNDKILKALSLYKRKQKNHNIKIVLFEYGDDYSFSRDLAKKLGVDDMIYWMPLLPRKEIMLLLSICDAVVGELARSWVSYGTIIEAMAVKKPVIHHRDDSLYQESELYPMFFANDEYSLANILCDLENRSVNDLAVTGKRGFQWLVEKSIQPAIADLLELVNGKDLSQISDAI